MQRVIPDTSCPTVYVIYCNNHIQLEIALGPHTTGCTHASRRPREGRPSFITSIQIILVRAKTAAFRDVSLYEGWNFNSGNYLFTTDTK